MRFLLQERSTDAKRLPGYWGFFGGGIRLGESPLEAVEREAFEELSYKVRSPVLFLEQPFLLEQAHQTVIEGPEAGYMWAFAEEFTAKKDHLRINEGRSSMWVTLDVVEELRMLEHDKVVIRTLCELLEKGWLPPFCREV